MRSGRQRRQGGAERESQLKQAKLNVLKTLWLYGRRRLDRRELEAYVEEKLEWRRKSCPEWIQGSRDGIRAIRDRLRRGVYDVGPKAGKPLLPKFRETLQRKIELLKQRLANEQDRLRELETESDPLRAWRLYRPRRRP